jgi:hypothetical protein
MRQFRVEPSPMGSGDETGKQRDPEVSELRDVVPARAVLTELARGFLLVHVSNPDRAVRFAETFLKECTAAAAPERVETTRPVTPARRQLGRLPRGAVDPSNFPPPR